MTVHRDQLSFDELEKLADEIRTVHQRIMRDKNALPDAVLAGELLSRAKNGVHKGEWQGWLTSHFNGHVTTAYGYIRLYSLREQLKDEQGAWRFTGIDPALTALSKSSLTPEAIQSMRALRKEGKTLDAIAGIFGVRKSTVNYHTSESRNRIKTLQKAERARGRQALERQRDAGRMKRRKDPLGEAYALLRRAEAALDTYLTTELSYEQRRHALEAMSGMYRAEDELVKAARSVEEPGQAA